MTSRVGENFFKDIDHFHISLKGNILTQFHPYRSRQNTAPHRQPTRRRCCFICSGRRRAVGSDVLQPSDVTTNKVVASAAGTIAFGIDGPGRERFCDTAGTVSRQLRDNQRQLSCTDNFAAKWKQGKQDKKLQISGAALPA